MNDNDNDNDNLYFNIDKVIARMSNYEAYWHAVNYNQHKKSLDPILLDDIFIKRTLGCNLKSYIKSERDLTRFLDLTGFISIPIERVRWFYNDQRAAFWLRIISDRDNPNLDSIYSTTDIDVFKHNLIFNKDLAIANRRISFDSKIHRDEPLGVIRHFDELSDTYKKCRINKEKIKFLKDRGAIDHSYQFIKNSIEADSNDCIRKFNLDEKNDKLNFILAYLDSINFDLYWLPTLDNRVDYGSTNDKRNKIIKKMRDAWYSKKSRDKRPVKQQKSTPQLNAKNTEKLASIAKILNVSGKKALNTIVETYYAEQYSVDPTRNPEYSSFKKLSANNDVVSRHPLNSIELKTSNETGYENMLKLDHKPKFEPAPQNNLQAQQESPPVPVTADSNITANTNGSHKEQSDKLTESNHHKLSQKENSSNYESNDLEDKADYNTRLMKDMMSGKRR